MRLGRVRHGERILKDSETHHPRFRPLCYASHADVLTASEYGVPQLRKRAFVLASVPISASLPNSLPGPTSAFRQQVNYRNSVNDRASRPVRLHTSGDSKNTARLFAVTLVKRTFQPSLEPCRG
jgi:site-specific DNA-cytosine methylase